MAEGEFAVFSCFYGRCCRVAPALLIVGLAMTAACFNPVFIGKELERENHAPSAEVEPEPSNVPLDAAVGDCAPKVIDIRSLDDVDGDELTVQFSILRTRNDVQDRVELKESPPLTPLESGSYPVGTPNTQLSLNDGEVGDFVGDGDFQLIELRISDQGIVADGEGRPVAGAGGALFFMSWLVKLQECPVVDP